MDHSWQMCMVLPEHTCRGNSTETQKDGLCPKCMARIFFAFVAVLVVVLLRHHAPDEAARARYQNRVYNIIDDVLEWSPSLALSGMMEKQTVANVTDGGAGGSARSESTEGENQSEPEEMRNVGDTNDIETS